MSGNVTDITSSQIWALSSYSYKVIASVFMWILILLIIVGNLLAIAGYCKTFRLRAVTRSFIVNLAATDLLVGALVMPYWFHRMLQETHNIHSTLYRAWVTLDISCATASISSLAILSIDRYIIISKSLSYDKLLSKSCAMVIILLIWLYALGLAFLRELKWNFYGLFVTTFAFVLPVSIMIFAYANIFKVARFQAHRIRRSSLPNVKQSRLNTKRFEKELKSTKTISLVIGAFLVCWMPFFLVTLVSQYCKRGCSISFELIIVVKWLHYANSAINPVIYAMHNREFRAALRTILSGKRSNVNLHLTAYHSVSKEATRRGTSVAKV